jgi:hypothetical protein
VFGAEADQKLTHFQSTNPFQSAIQATWQHSRDSSAVWGRKITGSTDAAYVLPDAIEWLLLEVSGALPGPTGGDRMLPARFIHRVNTVGGKEPVTACTEALLNQRRRITYESDYVFYRQARSYGGQ